MGKGSGVKLRWERWVLEVLTVKGAGGVKAEIGGGRWERDEQGGVSDFYR